MKDPSTGPIPRDRFYALVSAPAGEALKVIRKYDPFFGRPPGTKLKWTVVFTKEIQGYGQVEAASEEGAIKLGKNLMADDIEYDLYEARGGRGCFSHVEIEDQ